MNFVFWASNAQIMAKVSPYAPQDIVGVVKVGGDDDSFDTDFLRGIFAKN
jgi:hypothetical protein